MDTFAAILANLGLGCMFGLSGIGSIIGLVMTGNTVVGSIKKKPETFGLGLVLSALPATQGLYGFVGFIIFSAFVSPDIAVFNAVVIFLAGIWLGVVNIFSAVKMGQVCASGIDAIGSGYNVFGNTLVLAAFPEFYSILALVASILMSNLIKAVK